MLATAAAVVVLAACSSRAPVASPAPGAGADHAHAGATATPTSTSGAGADAHAHHAQPTQAGTPAGAGQPNPADVQFMSMMIGHHAQAIVMSRMAPTHAASASIQTLAARIINAQQDEIGIMQQWLRDRRQPVPEPHAGGMPMHSSMSAGHPGAGHEMRMPGMLSEAQMKQLDEARGPEFDRLFLTFMIQHHRGAVVMVKELFGSYGAGQDEIVFKFASDVNVDQTTEIARMERMLATLLFESPAQ